MQPPPLRSLPLGSVVVIALVAFFLGSMFSSRSADSRAVLQATDTALPLYAPAPSSQLPPQHAAVAHPAPALPASQASGAHPASAGPASPATHFVTGPAALRSPSTWCTHNPFLSSWGADNFLKAAEALVSSRGSLTRLALGEKYHAPAWAKFDVAPPLQRCSPVSRYPLKLADPMTWDDGGKLFCDIPTLKPGCVVYSLGSAGDFRFEQSMVEATPCEIFTFDCTMPSAPDTSFSPRVHFHPICLGKADDVRAKYRSLSSIAAQFGHTTIHLLKMDIEGYETEVVEALFNQATSADAAVATPLLSLLPMQFNIEVHWSVAMPDLAWSTSKGAAGMEAGDLALLWVQLTDLGYVPITRENNLECPHCAEFTMVRAFC